MVFFKVKGPSGPPDAEPAPAATEAQEPAAVAAPKMTAKPGTPAPAETNAGMATTDGSSEEQHEAYVEARSAELMDLAMNDDADSLNTILSELSNRDPKVRETAVQAAVQFHSRDAIPRLQDAALQTDDPKERAAIQEAIEFLKLPTLEEAAKEQAQSGAPGSPAPAH